MEQIKAITLCFLLTFWFRQNQCRNVEHMQQKDLGGVGTWNDFGILPSRSEQSQKQVIENSKLAFASYYNDHMVLQKAPQAAVVWGTYPDVGDRIIIKVSGPVGSYERGAIVEPGPIQGMGVWTVTLDPTPSGGPYSINAYADDGASIGISDVLFGDVWVCSGQSNMQFTTDQIFNASKELNESSRYKDIRLFTVAMELSTVPLYDLKSVAEYWSLPNATTVGYKPFKYFSAVCWLFGKLLYEKLGYPIGLIDTTWGGTPVEAWSSADALHRCGVTDQLDKEKHRKDEQYTVFAQPGDNSVLWNAMVNPLLKMTIYGAIWYQGEADSGDVTKRNRYNCTFPAMIDDWREKFSASSQQTDPAFPFGFVQLAGYEPDMMVSVGFPDIRWHQTADYGYVPNPRMKNTFMAVAMDLPDFTSPYGSVHPRDKLDVAQRLFMSGMPVAYNKSLPWVHGPRPVRVTLDENKNILLSYGVQPIRVLSREGFELCCSWNGQDECTPDNSWWLPTPVLSSNETTLLLDGSVCGEGQPIVGLRYAWRESPCVFKQCTVYALLMDNLPGPPFIAIKPAGAGFNYTIDWSKPQLIS